MKFDWTWLPVIVAIIILALIVKAYSAAAVTVHDGDTITYNGERIRLFGIDAPEKDQPGGANAREHLAQLIAGKELRIVPRDVDRYGRTVAIVYIATKSVNAAMVLAGWAWAYREYSVAYVAAEENARRAKRGLWAMPCPVAPWQYRNG